LFINLIEANKRVTLLIELKYNLDEGNLELPLVENILVAV